MSRTPLELLQVNPEIPLKEATDRVVPPELQNKVVYAIEVNKIQESFENVGENFSRITQKVDEVEGELDEFPVARPSQFEIVDDQATLVQPEIPVGGTVLRFIFPAVLGSLQLPISTVEIDLVGARRNTVVAYVNSDSIPSDLQGSNIRWFGDSFSTSLNDVNELRLTFLGSVIKVENTVFENEDIIDLSLIAYYKFEEDSNDFAQIEDVSFYQNDALIAVPSNQINRLSLAGISGNSLSYSILNSGNRFEASHNDSQVFQNGFTLVFWQKVSSDVTGNFTFCGKSFNSGVGFRVGRMASGGNNRRFEFQINNSGSLVNCRNNSADSINDSTDWVLVCARFDGTAMQLLLNGSVSATTSLSRDTQMGTGPLTVGGFETSPMLVGVQIDEFRVYNRVLSNQECLDIFNNENPN